MKDKKTFGSFIKEKRINKNYSQKDLADLLYVTESAVSKWERGVSYPDITLITDICRILEISEKELIQSSDDDEYRKIKKDSDKYNKLKKTIFWILNICYITAILTCFIVNIAVNHTLSWFFIVLAAILTAYSFVPTFTWISTKYKKLSFISTTFVSLFFLFLTCSIYTNNYWFMIPTVGLLLFYFIIFYPILFNEQRKHLDKDKYKQISIESKKLLTEVIFESEEWKLLDLGTIEKDYALGVMLSKLPVYLHEACKGIMNEWRDALIINDKMINILHKEKLPPKAHRFSEEVSF